MTLIWITFHLPVIFTLFLKLRYLIDAGLSLNDRSLTHNTPLHVAVANGRLDMTRYLLTRGADITMTTRSNATALYLAVHNDDDNMVEVSILAKYVYS